MPLSVQHQSHIEAWQSSGLTQVEYCRKHSINAKTFSNWLRRFRSEQVAHSVSPLVPVEIKPNTSLDCLSLHLKQGYTLKLSANVSPQWLGDLLKCLD